MKRILLSIVFIWIYSFAFSQITVSVTTQPTSCSGNCNGSATLTPSGGTAPYSYWMAGNIVSSNLTNLCVGQYTVIVSDSVSNYISVIVNITSLPGGVTATTTLTNNTMCWGPYDGIIDIIAGNGVPPYTYDLTAGFPNGTIHSTSPNLTNIGYGNYSYTVTDAVGCMLTQTLSMPYNYSYSVSTTQSNTSCNGLCDGTFSFSVTGGSGYYNYYLMYSGTGFPGIPITSLNQYNLCAGGYSITVTDTTNGCGTAAAVYIANTGNSSIPNTTITSTSYDETCHFSSDGAIDINITGANPGPFTYLWNNGATTQDLINIISDNYWVTIVDSNSNCMTLLDTIFAIGTNCGSISGNIFIDNNSDCLRNTGDTGSIYSSLLIQPGNRMGYTNTNGDYTINDLPFGTYSVSVNTNYSYFMPTCTTTLATTINSVVPNSTYNNLSIGFNSGTQPDMNVSAYSNGIVPGFISHVNYYITNMNNVNASGLYKITLPSAFISNIVNCSPTTYTLSGDTIIWNFSNLNYYNSYYSYYNGPAFSVYFTPPISTPLGSTFTSCIYAQPGIADFNYTNNNYCYSRIVAGSFDPNEKSVSPIGIGVAGTIASSVTDLTYLIRFQNTGNGPAVNIAVKDTLSSNLDVSTLEILSASHNYNIDILPGNVLRWKFNNIMLPDSNSNEPASHGYIQYRIKRNSDNAPGTKVKNTAYIYFDFNSPVVTNTAINTIELLSGIQSNVFSNKEIFIYPNPTSSLLNIIDKQNQLQNSTIDIKNYLGQVVFNSPFASQIDLAGLSAGMYFLTISDKANRRAVKIVKE